jgi:vacuolar-type H+-ATPase subunit E/Vma4
MGLQNILEKIRATREAQVQEIEQSAQFQANGILAQARADVRQIEEDACAKASAPAVAERARILHRARLEALRVVGDVREELVNAAINRARERLASIRADQSYGAVLRTLTKEALTELSSDGVGKAQLLVDSNDKVLMEVILHDLGLNLPVVYGLNCWGGLIANSQDGRVVVVNTFESRLERAAPFLRSHLAAFFEEEQSAVRETLHV